MKNLAKNKTKTIIFVVLAAAVAFTTVAVFLVKSQPSAFTLRDCEGTDCVIYLEDTINKCTWENGQIRGTTLVHTPPESMKRVSISQDQVDDYLKDAASSGKCTRPE